MVEVRAGDVRLRGTTEHIVPARVTFPAGRNRSNGRNAGSKRTRPTYCALRPALSPFPSALRAPPARLPAPLPPCSPPSPPPPAPPSPSPPSRTAPPSRSPCFRPRRPPRSPRAETPRALLFSAAPAQLVRDVIGPALAAGKVVILDRFFDSTLAYQGAGHGADRAGLDAVTRFAVGDVRPSRTFLLDVPVEVSAARARTRRADRDWDRFETDEQVFHQRVREGYLRLAAADPGRFTVIRGDRDEEAVAAEIRRETEPLLGTLRAP